MDNRKYTDSIDIQLISDTIQQTKQALQPLNIIPILLKRFDQLLTELTLDIGNPEYEMMHAEILEKIRSWTAGIYNKIHRKKISSNLKEIKKILPLFKDKIKESLSWTQQPIRKNFDDNSFLIDHLISSSNTLSLQLTTMLEAMNSIETPIKYYYPDYGNYDVAFITLPEDIELETHKGIDYLLAISSKHGNIPIILKKNNQIYLFGYPIKFINNKIKIKSTLTLLDYNKFATDIFNDTKNGVIIKNPLDIKKEIYQEIQEKQAHIHSILAKKIEAQKLIIKMKQDNIKKLIEGLEFYKKNYLSMQYKYRKSGRLLLEMLEKTVKTEQILVENMQEITSTKLKCDVIKKELEEVSLLLQTFRSRLKQENKYIIAEKTLDVIDKSSQEIRNQLYILFSYLEENLKNNQQNQENLWQYITRLENPINKFQTHSQSIVKKSQTLEFEKNIKMIFQLINEVADNYQNIEKTCYLDNIIVNAKSNLLSIKQHHLLAIELHSKIKRLVEQAYALEQQWSHQQSSSELLIIGPSPEASNDRIPTSIESADYIDLNDINSSFSKKNRQNQFQTIASFIKNQIKHHSWQVWGLNKKRDIIDSASFQVGVKKPILHSLKINAPHHANKIITELNQLEVKKAKNSLAVDYETTVNQVKEITRTALNHHSFFRTNDTKITYKKINYDIYEAKRLIKLKHPNETLQLIKNINQFPVDSINIITFETKCKTVYAADTSDTDKLIQLYFIAKEYLYNEKLTTIERNYFNHIIFTLLQIDIYHTIQNIKQEIIKKCQQNEWAVYLGGETLIIDNILYKVPHHVKQIWETMIQIHPIDQASIIDPSEKTHQLIHALSEIMYIAEKEAQQPHCWRHPSTQTFYMDIITSQNFLHYKKEPFTCSAGILCQNQN